MTDTPPSMRERLARVLIDSIWSDPPNLDKRLEWALPIVDAILTELQEPSEGMEWAGGDAVGEYCDTASVRFDADEAMAVWRAMIQHIKDGGT